MLQRCVYLPNIFCWFGPSSQARSCLPAQTRESSGSVRGPDVESSWQTSLQVCVTNCVAEQSGCCDSVTPAGSAQCRKSINRTSNSVGILRCLSPKDNGPIWKRLPDEMGMPDCPWIDKEWSHSFLFKRTGRGSTLYLKCHIHFRKTCHLISLNSGGTRSQILSKKQYHIVEKQVQLESAKYLVTKAIK